MYFSSKTLFVVSLPLLLLSSCEDFDFEKHYPDYGDKLKKEYTKNWIKEFGEIDPNQDWNMATRAEITVGAAGDYQIFAKSTGKIVGDYKNVSAGAKLGVDVLETEEELIVSNGCVAEIVKIGGVVFNGTRTTHIKSDGEIKVSVAKDENGVDKYIEFNQAAAIVWMDILPEGGTNKGKITQNFQFVSTGEFTIYPIYWNTSARNTLGLYFLDNSGIKQEVPIYTVHPSPNDEVSDPELQYQSNGTWIDVKGSVNGGPNPYNGNSNQYFSESETYRSRGITVTIPKGTVFGMYLDNLAYPYSGSKTTLYSEQQYNVDNEVYAGTFFIGDDMYLSFEDWIKSTGGDFDFNDMIFRFVGNKPIPVDKDSESWILACEDLGSTDDIDFNDLVLKVTHTSGQTTAKIQPLAAGGTLQSRYCFGPQDNQKVEIHHAFGESDHETGQYPMINTGSTKNGKTLSLPQPTTWTVSESFSLTTNDIGGIFIEVDQNDGQKEVKTITIKPTGKGTDAAPQMILVPDGWYWPRERVSIIDAYPNFKNWSGNASISDWFKMAAFDELVCQQ